MESVCHGRRALLPCIPSSPLLRSAEQSSVFFLSPKLSLSSSLTTFRRASLFIRAFSPLQSRKIPRTSSNLETLDESPGTLVSSLLKPVVFFLSPKLSHSSSLTTFRRASLSLRAFSPLQSRKIPHTSSNLETLDEFPGTLLSSLLKPVVVLLAIGATLFAGLRRPSPALALATESQDSPSLAEEELEALTDEKKEQILEEHLQSYPDDARSLRALMNLKVKAQKLQEAVGIVDRLIVLEPGEKDLILLKAHLQSYGGDTETSKQLFEEILQKDPLFVEAYHGLVMTASGSESEQKFPAILDRIQAAIEICKKEKKKEELRDFRLLVAQIRVMEGNYEEALKLYQELVKEEPRDFRPYLCQGIIYTLLRKKDEAGKQFQKYRRLVPKGHPYAQYFDENMTAMNFFGEEAKSATSPSSSSSSSSSIQR